MKAKITRKTHTLHNKNKQTYMSYFLKPFVFKSLVSVIVIIIVTIVTPHTKCSAQVQLKVGGYMQTWLILNQHQESREENTDTWGFRLRRARLTGQTDLADIFQIVTWIEFSGPQRHLLDFYITAKISPALNNRLGQFRAPGQMYYTGILSSSQLLFYERPAISTRLSGYMGYDSFRDIGLQVMGSVGPVWYALYMGNGMGRFVQAGSNIASRDFGSGLYGGRVDINPVKGFIIGTHFAMNKQSNVIRDGSSPYDINRTSYSFRFATDDFIISDLFTESELGGGVVDDTDTFNYKGWYIQAGYRLSNSLSLITRYDFIKENTGSVTITEEQNLTFGIMHYVMQQNKEIIRLGANYSFGDSKPGGLNRNIFLLWVQIRFIP